MSEQPAAGLVRASTFVSLAMLACSTDTSGLARSRSESGGGGEAGVAQTPGEAGAAGASEGGEGGSPELAPSGPGSLTLVHGLVDGGNLFACLRHAASGEPLRGDVPEPPSGIPYGSNHPLELDWDLELDGVQAELLALAPNAAQGRSCTELLAASSRALPEAMSGGGSGDAGSDAAVTAIPFPTAPDSPRRAGSFVFAAGALRPGASYVLVASGCTSLSALAPAEICGSPDAFSGALGALPFVELAPALSQPAPYFGVQFLNASRAITSADVVLQAESDSAESVSLANDVRFGALRPRTVVAVEEPIGVELHVQRAARADYVQSWADVLSASGLPAIEPGEAYLLVYLGPNPVSGSVEGVAPPRFVLVSR